MKKNKTNTLKIVLFVFLGITIVGITASLFRGLRNEYKDSGSGTHKHSFEIVSTVPGTCTEPGMETLKCTYCSYEKTREIPGDHNYSEFDICNNCGYSEVHTKLTSTITTNPDDDTYSLGSFSKYEKCVFLILFNQGLDDEYGYFVYYDGTDNFTSDVFNYEMQLKIENGEIIITSGTSDLFSSSPTLAVYLADPSATYIKLEISKGIYNDEDEMYPCECYVGGELVVIDDAPGLICADEIEAVLCVNGTFAFMLIDMITGDYVDISLGSLSSDNPRAIIDLHDMPGIYTLDCEEC